MWDAYQDILEGRLTVLPVDLPVAQSFAELIARTPRSGRARAPLDLLIAATARAHGLVVATCNARHFAGLEGVAVEDWSVDPASS